MGEALHPRRPVHDHHGLFSGLVGNGETSHLHGFNGSGSIGELVTTRQTRQWQIDQPIFILEDHAAMFLECEEILSIDRQRAIQAIGG